MRHLLLTSSALLIASLMVPGVRPALGQGILPELMYGVYALDKSCDVGSRRMLVTPSDILIADPGLDIRISYPDQRTVVGDEVTLAGNFFVSVLYEGSIRRTAEGAVMSFHFPDLSFPLLNPIIEGLLGKDSPTSMRADLNLVDQGDLVSMALRSDDLALGERLSRVIGTWNFDAAQITRLRGENKSVYPRCFEGRSAQDQHASLVHSSTGVYTGVYARDGQCAVGGEAFIIAEDGWGISLPFADPTIGFAFASQGAELVGELYRAPFAPLAPNENSYIDIEVRDGASSHRLSFSGDGFAWTKTLSTGDAQDVGSYSKCREVGAARFADVAANIKDYLN